MKNGRADHYVITRIVNSRTDIGCADGKLLPS